MADAWRIGTPAWAMECPRHCYKLLVALWGYADNDEARAYAEDRAAPPPWVWCSRETLAQRTGTSPRQLDRQMAALIKAGYLRPEVREVRGHRIQGRLLCRPPLKEETPPTDPDPSSMTVPPHADDPSSVTSETRHGGHEGPVTGDQRDPSSVTGQSLPDLSLELSHELSSREQLSLAGSAREDGNATTPEPLRLELDEPDRLDPERVAADVGLTLVQLRRELGAKARHVRPSPKDIALVTSAQRIAGGPVADIPDGAVDLRTAPGLVAFWRLLGQRKAEELRRRSATGGSLPALAADWLTLRTLARDAADLLSRDDLDERRGPASARASPGPPQNGLDLARYHDLLEGDLDT